MQKDTAYELDVEIIKEYADVRKDILDVLNVIERGDNFRETLQKVRIGLFFQKVTYNLSSYSLSKKETSY